MKTIEENILRCFDINLSQFQQALHLIRERK